MKAEYSRVKEESSPCAVISVEHRPLLPHMLLCSAHITAALQAQQQAAQQLQASEGRVQPPEGAHRARSSALALLASPDTLLPWLQLTAELRCRPSSRRPSRRP